MSRLSLLLLLNVFVVHFSISQSASINDDGASPDASAILDIASTSQGVLIPRMTSTQVSEITSPATGLIVFNTEDETYYQYNGADWVPWSAVSSGTSTSHVPSNPSLGQQHFAEIFEKLYIYTGSGWSLVASGSVVSSPYEGSTITITIGAGTGSSLHISSWTDIGVDGYAIAINTSDSFSQITDGVKPLASETYEGYGEQIVYLDTVIASFDIELLAANQTYYIKAFPYTGDYDFGESQITISELVGSCDTSSTTESQVCFDYSETSRTIYSNQIPDHETGSFPNADILATQVTRELDPEPALTGSVIYVYDETGQPTPSNPNFYQFGMAINGVEFHPMGLKPWTNPDTDEENWEWQEAVVDEGNTFLDDYGAHVTSKGVYHYHGDIAGLAAEEDGLTHSKIYGFAADGFPIYYKYGYTDEGDSTSTIKELVSSYQLRSGSRPGDGTDEPDGTYDGTYIQDYEYINGLGDLDECNGRFGPTPEYPDGTYYYMITSDFPKVPNCFMGSPEDDWIIGN